MKKRFLLLITLLFCLSGCSQSVNNPYEIVKGTSMLSYYDTKDNIDIEGFNVLEMDLQNILDQNNSIIVNENGVIRCITITDDTVKTFRSISVGDKIEKIEHSFNHESQFNNVYLVLFNNNIEEDPDSQDKEDTWIWIAYYTDGSQITFIKIYDVLYGRAWR